MTQFTKDLISSRAMSGGAVRQLAVRLAGILGFMGLIAVGAHARFLLPFTPVPVTLQTLVVLLAGAILAPLDAALAVGGYLALGAGGVPLFAKAGAPVGLSYFAGATGGYLIAFFVVAATLGAAVRRFESVLEQFACFLVASQFILVLGTIWLKAALALPWLAAFVAGYVWFVPVEVLKCVIAVGAYRWTRRFH